MSTLPTAQDRLSAYYDAERTCLQALQVGHGDRSRRMAELSEIRAGIAALRAEIAAQDAATRGSFGLPVMLASFNPGFSER